MKALLTPDLAATLVRGASLLTTGGGLAYKAQLDSLKRLGEFYVPLVSATTLDPDGYLVTLSEIGAADAPEIDKANIIQPMLHMLEDHAGVKVCGLYAPEIGQEAGLIAAAHQAGLPLVDFDLAGGRAVPRVDIATPVLLGMDFSYAPCVVATPEGHVSFIKGADSLDELEKVLRSIAVASSSGLVCMLGGLLKVSDVLRYGLENASLSLALQLTVDNLDEQLKPRLSVNSTVVARKPFCAGGFNLASCLLDTAQGGLTLHIKNEALALLTESGCIAAVPERLLLVDMNKGYGLHSSELVEGKSFCIKVIAPQSPWNSAVGHHLFGWHQFAGLFEPL